MATFFQKQEGITCSRCNKPLTDPKSVAAGIGPVCAVKLIAESGKKQKGKCHIVTGNARQGEDIVLKRTEDGTPTVNLIQKKVYHSPDGFEFGYAGSGPADLALNILLLYLPFQEAMVLHQDFKFKFISGIPYTGGIIKGGAIQEYVDSHAKTLFDQ